MPAPTPKRLFFSLLVVIVVVFLRPPTTNFIFDEQEALLGNPVLQNRGALLDVFSVDFWGRSPERTIGAYRPLPNLIWRPFALSLALHTPWVLSLLNLIVHAMTATLLACAVRTQLSRTDLEQERQELAVWVTGLGMACAGVLSEAVCAVVGLADLLVGFFAASFFFVVTRQRLARPRDEWKLLGFAFGFVFLGLLSKETMLSGLGIFPLVTMAFGSGELWRRARAAGGTFVSSSLAVVAFVVFRRTCFPSKLADVGHHAFEQGWLSSVAAWFAQPKMPAEFMNNPMFEASSSERFATASLLFLDQLGQMLLPLSVSGDYSFPAFVVVNWTAISILGAILFFALGILALMLIGRHVRAPDDAPGQTLIGLGASWLILAYLPISNALVLLPTIRGERLLYLPLMGVVLFVVGVAVSLSRLSHRTLAMVLFGVFLLHAGLGRAHALRYSNDVSFWRSTAEREGASAKAHLNLGVMLGARGDEEARLKWTRSAARLAPHWPMGQIYLGDTLCRLERMDEAWIHYERGLRAQPNSKALTALTLQCLWDKKSFQVHKHQLFDLAATQSGSWLDYFVDEMARSGDEHDGIPKKYRPRRYNDAASANR